MPETKVTSTNIRLACLIASLVFALAYSSPLATAKDIANDKTGSADLLRLDHGAALVSGSDRDVKVVTRFGHVVCRAGVTVYVFDNGKGVSVFDLDSVGKEDVRLKLGNSVLRLKPAQQLLISDDKNATFDEINPKLGIVHRKPQSIAVGNGLVGFVTEFSLASAIRNISSLNAMTKSSDSDKRETVRRILKNATILQPSAALYMRHRVIPPGTAAYAPASVIDGAAPTRILQGKVEYFDKDKVRNIDMTLSKVRTEPLELISGTSWLEYKDSQWKKKAAGNEPGYVEEIAGLITCPVSTSIKTELCSVDCKQGVAAFVIDHGDSVSVCTLESPNVGAVVVHIGNHFVRLAPGRQILVTKNIETPVEDVSPAKAIGHRNIHELAVFDGVKVIAADFSLPSAMLAIEPIRQMVNSKDGEERRLARLIAKNSIVLSGLTIHDGLFKAPKGTSSVR